MKIKNILFYITVTCLCAFNSCTDLSETVYSEIVTENYYNTREDIIRASLRPFEHGFFSVRTRQVLNEASADVIGIWQRDGWWYDAGRWEKFHKHTWEYDSEDLLSEWETLFKGVMQCVSVIEDLQALNPADFNMSETEMNNFIAQNKTMHAYFYIRLLDIFRNIPLVTTKNIEISSILQASPEDVFEYIEEELKWSLINLEIKSGSNGNNNQQGQWTQAGAASLLVRLYLNAEKWIGIPKYTECARYAQEIIDGKYGSYDIDEKWDAPFEWNNDMVSKEVIFAFPSSFGYNHWHYDSDVILGTVSVRSGKYFGAITEFDPNGKYSVQPGHDLNGNEYNYELGKFVVKFQKYPEDYRLIKYRNQGGGSREGMFLYGLLDYEEDGGTKYLEAPDNRGYRLDLWDRGDALQGGSFNDGWCLAKYPCYGESQTYQYESDYVEIRLSEIYYSLAECKFRENDLPGAATLLNKVRRRYYPSEKHKDYLYQPEGNVELTLNELLDEWGREFIAEGRRRIDLIRWNKFSEGIWWEKSKDSGTHTEIYPIPRNALGTNKQLKQNSGY